MSTPVHPANGIAAHDAAIVSGDTLARVGALRAASFTAEALHVTGARGVYGVSSLFFFLWSPGDVVISAGVGSLVATTSEDCPANRLKLCEEGEFSRSLLRDN